MELNRNRVISENKTTPKPAIFFFFSFFLLILLSLSSSSITSNAGPDNRCCSSAKSGRHTNLQHYQPIANCATWRLPADGRRVAPQEVVGGDHEHQDSRLARRELGGPGSSPPRCASKCGKCTPCTAVHVPVPPGTPVTAEYYPEAWRCKCGNKLYMP